MTQPKQKRSGLGRGLASLIPTGPADDDCAHDVDPICGSRHPQVRDCR